MTEPTGRVCSRCGAAAGENDYCSKCGLHLAVEPELPTRDEWEAVQGEPQGADAIQSEVAGSQGDGTTATLAPAASGTSDRSSPQEPSPPLGPQNAVRLGPKGLVMAGIAGVIIVGVTVVVIATSGSQNTSKAGVGGARHAPSLSQVQNVLTRNPNFIQTATASEVSCQDIGPLGDGEEYTCNISGVQQPTQWLWGNGDVSMVSNGGDQGSPPADANAAASLVQNSGSGGFQPTYVTCAALTHDSIGIAIQNAYNCTLSGDGGQVTVTYRWNNDGTIRQEQLAGS